MYSYLQFILYLVAPGDAKINYHKLELLCKCSNINFKKSILVDPGGFTGDADGPVTGPVTSAGSRLQDGVLKHLLQVI